MFITKTITQKNHQSGKNYYSYRLVRTYRNAQGKVRKETILNLGNHFIIAENQWKLLTDRIEDLLNNSNVLFDNIAVSAAIEKEAKRIVKLITKRSGVDAFPVKPTSALSVVDYQSVDINSTQEDEVRHIGNEHVAYHAALQLNLPNILLDVGLSNKQANIALAAIIAKLIKPGSELRAHKYLTQESALDEIIDYNLSSLDLQYMYFASDWLLSHKGEIEELLYARECELFNLTQVITLFDITNTYFEGDPNHCCVARGRSKEKRTDCELISLGLLLDGSGFPRKSKILPGNISEPSTLEEMLTYLNTEDKAIVIMDAGIATKNNIELLTNRGYRYIVVKRDIDLVLPIDNHTVVKDTLNNVVTASMVQREGVVDLYCHSTAKEAQTIEFTNKVAKRFEEELNKLKNNLRACNLYVSLDEVNLDQAIAIITADGKVYVNNKDELISAIKKKKKTEQVPSNFSLDAELSDLLIVNKDILRMTMGYTGQVRQHSKLINKLRYIFSTRVYSTKVNVTRHYTKVAIKLGRLCQQYKAVAHMYDVEIIADKKKQYATDINYIKDVKKLATKQAGIYCLTSNVTHLSADALWNTYTMLTEIESAFRSLKSELGMRPVYHQLEHRIDGHIFISILAYHLLHTIRYQLKQRGINNNWESLRNILSMQIRSTTSQNLESGGVVRIRKTSNPTVEQTEIYNALNITNHPIPMVKSYVKK